MDIIHDSNIRNRRFDRFCMGKEQKMTRTEIIEALKVIYKELNMSVSEYIEYANEKYGTKNYKLKPDTAWAFRTGAVKTQIENVLSALEQDLYEFYGEYPEDIEEVYHQISTREGSE